MQTEILKASLMEVDGISPPEERKHIVKLCTYMYDIHYNAYLKCIPRKFSFFIIAYFLI